MPAAAAAALESIDLGTSNVAGAALGPHKQQEDDKEQQQQQKAGQQLLQQAAAQANFQAAGAVGSQSALAEQPSLQQLQQYRPFINSQGLWEISSLDLDAIAIGAQILGTGGGGSARHNRLKLEHATSAAAAAALLDHQQDQQQQQQEEAGDRQRHSASQSTSTSSSSSSSSRQQKLKNPLIMSLKDLPDDAFICDVGGMGAPTVSAEKLNSFECSAAVRGLSAALPRPITALLCAEVGGGNALEPLAVGMQQGLPVVDADLMGRAFPELQMSTAAIAGVSLTPAAVADDKGNVLVMAAAASPNWAETVLR
jgi:hypothetical protein